MSPFFTIITPTILRESLVRCCESVSGQTFRAWQHIVVVDRQPQRGVPKFLLDDRRQWSTCGTDHRDFGNTCRRNAYGTARGEYVIYLDDDNYLADEHALERIAVSLYTEHLPDWAIFPILRRGARFFSADPRRRKTDTANMVLRRPIAQWPATKEYEADGILADYLREKYLRLAGFPYVDPIIVVPESRCGR